MDLAKPLNPRRGGRGGWTAGLILLPLALLLGGCQAGLEIDLGVSSPERLERLELDLRAVELRDEDGGILRLEVDNPGRIDLLAAGPEQLRRILSDSDVAERRYQALRLVFDDREGEAELDDGSEVPVVLAAPQPFLPLDLRLEQEEERRVAVMLDLRFSVADRRSSDGRLLFRQAGSATDAEDAATLAGDVSASFARREDCATDRGYALYLYPGSRQLVNDHHADDAEPPLRSATLEATDDEDFRYRFSHVPAGRYTLAYTCTADFDDPITDDAVTLRDLVVIDLAAGRETERDF